MANRNLVRSWLAASVLALSAATPLLAAPTPAAAADNVTITVTVRDDGFSQSTIDARVGDYVIFRLDDAAMGDHTLAWDQGQVRFTFSRPNATWVRYGGRTGLNAGTVHFYDAAHVSDSAAGGPFTGTLTVRNGPPPPPPSSTSSTSTTVTAPPSTATTTTTAPTTTTSEPSAVRPFRIPDPDPTTTTTAVSNPANGGPTKNGGATATTANKEKDKGKSKAAAAETPTTLAPAPPAAPPDSIFDAESLTPSPTTLPDAPSVSDSGDNASLSAASVLSLIDPDKPADDDNTRLLLIAAGGAFALLVVVAGMWCWLHRASQYDPA
jgi:hypothetical protein